MDSIAYVESPSLLERLEFCLRLMRSDMLSLVESPSEGAALRSTLTVLDSVIAHSTMDYLSANNALAELFTENFSLDRVTEVSWAQQLGANPEMERPTDKNPVGVHEYWAILQRGLEDQGKDRRLTAGSPAAYSQEDLSFSRDNFSYKLSVGLMLRLSSGWSYRDIQKFVANVKSRVMSSDRSH